MSFLVFGVKDTLSKKSKIKPTPYVQLKLIDRINLPQNFNVSILIWDGNTSESTDLVTIKGIRRKKVKIFSRKLKPETKYYVTVRLYVKVRTLYLNKIMLFTINESITIHKFLKSNFLYFNYFL